MRPEKLAEHLAGQVKALLAARDLRAERQAAALAALQKTLADVQARLEHVEGRTRELERDAALER